MQIVPLLGPIIVPICFWAAYHYHKDRHLPEPIGHLLLCLALGAGAAGISKGLYFGLEPLGLRLDAVALADSAPLTLFAYSVLAIGPIEELAKMLPFLIIVLRFEAFDEPLDGLIYASFIGLGYAAAENMHYLDLLTPVEAAARGFAAPVVHILFASIWAHRISSAKVAGGSISRAALQGLLLAAFGHGVYDFLVLLQPVTALPIAASLIIAIWIWRLRLMQQMHQDAIAGPKDAR